MMVQCDRHGQAAGLQVSPDLEQLVASAKPLPAHREFIYNYDGESYIRIVVSEAFAAARDLGDGGTFDLPDEYPAWHKELSIVCENCLESTAEA